MPIKQVDNSKDKINSFVWKADDFVHSLKNKIETFMKEKINSYHQKLENYNQIISINEDIDYKQVFDHLTKETNGILNVY